MDLNILTHQSGLAPWLSIASPPGRSKMPTCHFHMKMSLLFLGYVIINWKTIERSSISRFFIHNFVQFRHFSRTYKKIGIKYFARLFHKFPTNVSKSVGAKFKFKSSWLDWSSRTWNSKLEIWKFLIDSVRSSDIIHRIFTSLTPLKWWILEFNFSQQKGQNNYFPPWDDLFARNK